MKGNFSTEYFWYLMAISLLLLILCLIIFMTIRFLKSVHGRDSFSSNKIFDHGINTLLSELSSLKEQIKVKERLALLGELSASIIHQVRNPLAVMAGYARLIEKSAPEQSLIKDYAQNILDEIQNINEIMEGLLKLSETSILRREKLELSGLIHEVIVELETDKSNLHIDVPEILINGDKVLLKQALKNIIQNALEAGSIVEIRAKDGPQNTCTIEIEDNGPGIPEEERDKIFLPFYSKKSGFRGMGLSIAQKVIYSNDGTITVRDSPKGGTIFSITLPKERNGNDPDRR